MSDKKDGRTIQVKIGQQSAREMTPDQAAEFLAAATGHPDRVALSFGRSGTTAGPNWKFNSSVDTENNAVRTNSRSGSSNIPCTEKEMKALMSMFVEIMGLQMNTERLNASPRRNLFKFPRGIPPPPGGWPADLAWPTDENDDSEAEEEDDDDDDDDSLPDLEDIPPKDREPKIPKPEEQIEPTTETTTQRLTTYSQASSGYVAGIAVPEWEALERVAMEDALEQEERARKAAQTASSFGKNGKRASQRLNIPTGTSPYDALDKRRAEEDKKRQDEKAVAQWRQKIISTCQSNDAVALKNLFDQVPIDIGQDPIDNNFQKSLMDLAGQCLPKNRQSLEKGLEARIVLLQYVLKSPSPQVLLTPQRNGRSVLHTSCFHGDVKFVKMILDNASAFDNLASTCEESGFTPLHYACLSGSAETVQLLVQKDGSSLKDKVTNDTHTWDPSSGKGLSVTRLLQSILQQPLGKNTRMETHGMAVVEVQKYMMGNKASAARFRIWIDQVISLLEDDSFRDLTEAQLREIDSLLLEKEPVKLDADDVSANISEKSEGGSTVPTKMKKRRHKKKQKQSATTEEDKPATASEKTQPSVETSVNAVAQDPLVILLKGMGFEEGLVVEGIAACGGPSRATADVVIAWMLERNQPEILAAEPNSSSEVSASATTPGRRKTTPVEISAETRVPEQRRPSYRNYDEKLNAERLAAKREERRQRNREWNKKQEAQRVVPTSKPATFPKQQQPPALQQQQHDQQSVSLPGTPGVLSGRTVEFSVDTATVVSSVGDYAKDDDLTVSTLGSRTTTTQNQGPLVFSPPAAATPTQPLYMQSSLAQQLPPGFSGLSTANISSVTGTNSSVDPWQTTPPPSYTGSAIPPTPPPGSFAPPGLNQHLYSGLPPGIPETHSVVEERGRPSYVGSGMVGAPPVHMDSRSTGAGGHSFLSGRTTSLFRHGNSVEALGVTRPHSGITVPGHLASTGLGGPSHAPFNDEPPRPIGSTTLLGGIPGAPHGGMGGSAPPVLSGGPNEALGTYGQSPMSSTQDSFGAQGISTRNIDSYNQYSANNLSFPPGAMSNPGFRQNESHFLPTRTETSFLGNSVSSSRRPPVAPSLQSSTAFSFSASGVESSGVGSLPSGSDLARATLWGSSNPLTGSGGGQQASSSFLSQLIGESEPDRVRNDSLFGQNGQLGQGGGSQHNRNSIW